VTKFGASLAWALLAGSILIASASVLLAWRNGRAPDIDLYIPSLVAIPAFMAFVVVGVLIVTRSPDNRFGWLLLAVGLSWELFVLVDNYTTFSYGLHGVTCSGARSHCGFPPGASFRTWDSSSSSSRSCFPAGGSRATIGVSSSGWRWPACFWRPSVSCSIPRQLK
jgi:hypothetical protein